MNRAAILTTLAVLALAAAVPAVAGQRPQPVTRGATQRVDAQPDVDRTAPVADERDARETRERFKDVLDRYPPTVGRVLKMDPSLLSNQNYLASYPAIASFVGQHPEIAHNPQYFLEFVYLGREFSPPDRTQEAMNVWRDILGGLALLIGFLVVTMTLGWLVRALMDYRRWYRLSKLQSDAHNKVFDRLVSNEDLLSYIHTPAGQRFLESAPIDLDMGPRTVRPLARILWSIQAGVVVAAAGLGILFVSKRVVEEVAQPLFAVGALALSIGAGFLVSALIAFVLSRRMGLFAPAAAPERPGAATPV